MRHILENVPDDDQSELAYFEKQVLTSPSQVTGVS